MRSGPCNCACLDLEGWLKKAEKIRFAVNKEGLAALNNESVLTPDDGDISIVYCWREEYKL
jgi:hypothetical protein